MSLAAFTDSTTATAFFAAKTTPTFGGSTNTMSVSSACAWSVMPTVPMPFSIRIHSWVSAYLRSSGTFMDSVSLEKWLFDNAGFVALSAHFDFDFLAGLRKSGGEIRHRDSIPQGR